MNRQSLYGVNYPRNVLNGYDILAKIFPGMALFVGLISFLPNSDKKLFGNSLFLSLISTIIVLVLIGILIGEAVHILSETFEKGIFKPLRGLKRLSKLIIAKLPYRTPKFAASKNSLGTAKREADRDNESGIENDLLDNNSTEKGWRQRISSFILQKKSEYHWKLNLVFKQHRQLLVDLVESNYDEFLGYWRKKKKGELFDRFSDSVYKMYGVRVEHNHDSLIHLYPSIMSRLYMSQARLSKRFQIIFSFCRSMWMTFLLVTIGYLYVIFIGPKGKLLMPFVGSYVPRGAALLQSHSIPLIIIPVITAFITVGFLAASGKYKYHYIEYIIADFAHIVGAEDEVETSKQKQLREFSNQGSDDLNDE